MRWIKTWAIVGYSHQWPHNVYGWVWHRVW
jgi:hypothetical protein